MSDFCSKCNSTVSFSNKFCTNCGNELLMQKNSQDLCDNCNSPLNPNNSFCTNCGKKRIHLLTSKTNVQNAEDIPRSRAWYLLPIFFGIIGGLIAYFVLRNSNKQMGKNCLMGGAIISVVPVVISMAAPFDHYIPNNILESTGSISEIDNRLSGLSDQIQAIKLEQIMDCENNVGYLQSMEMGDMIKERCINSVMQSIP